MRENENSWLSSDQASGLIPSQATAGSFLLRHPPDPLTPTLPLTINSLRLLSLLLHLL